ncbi:unnamed protein product [Amoebophrya sp. A120]|nr:unnamed protein product [Amoebophrya sp. A120]|eukprot:GSA120T00024398001.1
MNINILHKVELLRMRNFGKAKQGLYLLCEICNAIGPTSLLALTYATLASQIHVTVENVTVENAIRSNGEKRIRTLKCRVVF